MISSILFVVVCRWCIYHDNLCLTVLIGLNWLRNGMLINDDATMWWYIIGSVIYDWFITLVSGCFSNTMIQIQLSNDLRFVRMYDTEEARMYMGLHQNNNVYILMYLWTGFVGTTLCFCDGQQCIVYWWMVGMIW